MTPKELLGVLVRLAGLGLLLCAVFDFYFVIAKAIGTPTASVAPISRDVQRVLFYLLLGFCVLAGVRPIVRLAYWQKD